MNDLSEFELFDQWVNETHLNDQGHWDGIKAYIVTLEKLTAPQQPPLAREIVLEVEVENLREALIEATCDCDCRDYFDTEAHERDCNYIHTLKRHRLHAQTECKCNLRTKLVGDGCSVCNPSYLDELNTAGGTE